MDKQEHPDMLHPLAHLCSHAAEGLICAPCGTLAYEATRIAIDSLLTAEKESNAIDVASVKEAGAVSALEGMIAWLGELSEKHPRFASSTGTAALYVERYIIDNFRQEESDNQ